MKFFYIFLTFLSLNNLNSQITKTIVISPKHKPQISKLEESLLLGNTNKAITLSEKKVDKDFLVRVLGKYDIFSKETQKKIPSIIKNAIKNGSDVNAKDSLNYTPLIYASLKAPLRIIKILVENGANVNPLFGGRFKSPLINAISHRPFKNEDIVKYLIDNGADVNFNAYDYPRIGKFATPLIAATNFNLINIVKYLVSHGANLRESIWGFKLTPLHFAVFYGNLDIVKYFVAHGADVNANALFPYDHPRGHFEHRNPLNIAIERKHYKIIEFLKKNGAKEF